MKKIIVIDPEKGFWKKVEQVVNTDTCEVVFLENGSGLINKLKEQSFDLIILNLELPDKNGFVYCNLIKKDKDLKNIPVIITSSVKTEEDFEQHRKLKVRAQDYLKKPIDLTVLKETIMKYLPNEVKREEKKVPISEDTNEKKIEIDELTEDNIDKLLDETFVGLIEEDKPANGGNVIEIPPIEEEGKKEEKQTKVEDLEKEIENLLSENKRLKSEIKNLAKQIEAGKVSTEESEKLKKEMEKLKAELEMEKEHVKELNVQNIALEKEKGFLEKENRDLLMSVTTLKADFSEKIKQQEEENQALKSENALLKENMGNLNEENKKLKEKVEELENNLSILSDEKDGLINRITELTEKETKLSEELKIATEAKQALEETIFEVKEETAKLQEELKNKDNENIILLAQIKESEEKIKKLEQKLSVISELVEKLNKEVKEND